MKPSLLLIKREIGRNLENPKTEVSFAIVNSDVRRAYPANFVCVLPLSHCLFSEHSIFSKLFDEDSIPLAKRRLSKALAEENDSETKMEIGKRLKHLNPKTVVEAKCRVCGNLFEPESFRGITKYSVNNASYEWLSAYSGEIKEQVTLQIHRTHNGLGVRTKNQPHCEFRTPQSLIFFD